VREGRGQREGMSLEGVTCHDGVALDDGDDLVVRLTWRVRRGRWEGDAYGTEV
jgi:hypothetical protein